MKKSINYYFIFSILFLLCLFTLNINLSIVVLRDSTLKSDLRNLQLGISSIFYFLTIVSFLQYVFFKELLYFYYIFYLSLYLLYYTLTFSRETKLSDNFIPYFIQIRTVLTVLLLIFAYYIYNTFAMIFLNAKNHNKFLYKKLKIISSIYIYLVFGVIISVFLKKTFGNILIIIILSCCIPIGIFGITLIFLKAKNVFGRILTIGSFSIFLGSIFGFLFSFELIPYPSNKFPFNYWLFYTMLGAIIEVIIFFGSFAYRNKILANEEQLSREKLQIIRDEISRDLHDDVGASLSNINILNELAKRNASNPAKANEYLSKAGEDIQHVSESLSDIVWNINSRYDDLENLFVRMKRYASDMFDGKDIFYTINFPNDTKNLVLSMDKRKDFYFIFKEAINNVVKYSEAKHAQVSVKVNDNFVELKVTDDGIGFDPQKIESGNGLVNMKHRAKVCNAKITVDTKPGNGTHISLKMNLN
jgi:signal transduction histidine kinase